MRPSASTAASFAGRTVLVTGAASGLGAAIAESFLRTGAAVVCTDVDPKVHHLARDIDSSGQRTLSLVFDVSDESAFTHGFAEAVARFGRVDVLVNNAAITATGSPWDIDLEEWDRVMAVNLRGTFIGCRTAGEHMRTQRGGRIINLSSFAGQHPSRATGLHYAASKAGILAVTRGFALELAPAGVTVNAIAPSAIEGPQLASLSADRRDALLRTIPLGRAGHTDEVTAAVRWLASDGASYVTGQTLDINGGRG